MSCENYDVGPNTVRANQTKFIDSLGIMYCSFELAHCLWLWKPLNSFELAMLDIFLRSGNPEHTLRAYYCAWVPASKLKLKRSVYVQKVITLFWVTLWYWTKSNTLYIVLLFWKEGILFSWNTFLDGYDIEARFLHTGYGWFPWQLKDAIGR